MANDNYIERKIAHMSWPTLPWIQGVIAFCGATVLAVCAFKVAYWFTAGYYIRTEPRADTQLGIEILANGIAAFLFVEAAAWVMFFWLQRKNRSSRTSN